MHKNDLAKDVIFNGDLAIDSETMGLNIERDRLCVIQLSDGNGEAHLVQFTDNNYDCPNLKKLLAEKTRIKIFHFARFDVAVIQKFLNIEIENIFCTKIASKICRTYTDSHSLKELCRELLGINLSKHQQTSYWGSDRLSQEQIDYAANDVLYLHKIKEELIKMLAKEDRLNIALRAFEFIPLRAKLDWIGWKDIDIFAH